MATKTKTATKRIPLVPQVNRRLKDVPAGDLDQVYENVLFSHMKDSEGEITTYLERRPGLKLDTTLSGSNNVYKILITQQGKKVVSAGSSVYVDGTIWGNFVKGGSPHTDAVDGWGEGFIDASLARGVYLFCSGGSGDYAGKGIYYLDFSLDVSEGLTFTGDTSSGTPTLSNCTAGAWDVQTVQVGQLITGTGIPTGTRVKAVNYSANTVTLGTDDETEVNATASNTTVTFTIEPMQKVMDASMTNILSSTGSYGSNPVYMDGYVFFLTNVGKLYQSEYNDPQTWLETSYVVTTRVTDQAQTLIRCNHLIGAVSGTSIEFFRNVGNPQGSVLKRVVEETKSFGTYQADSDSVPVKQHKNWTAFSNHQSVYLMDNNTRKIEEITNIQLANTILDQNVASGGEQACLVSLFSFLGKDYVLVSQHYTNTAYPCMLYDIQEKVWIQQDFGKNVEAWSHPTRDVVYFISMNNNGLNDIYSWNPIDSTLAWNDDSGTTTQLVQTAKNDLGTQRYKRIRRLTLIGDKAASACTVNISWSDDDYGTFTTARSVDMNNNRASLTELGVMRRPIFKLTSTSAQPQRWEALELEFEVLNR